MRSLKKEICKVYSYRVLAPTSDIMAMGKGTPYEGELRGLLQWEGVKGEGVKGEREGVGERGRREMEGRWLEEVRECRNNEGDQEYGVTGDEPREREGGVERLM